jgi:hypothetical protein
VAGQKSSAMLDPWKEFLPLVPILTFIGGYLLSNIDKFRESRRKLRNMKRILFKEMSEIYKQLNPVVGTNKEIFPDPVLICLASQKFSFAIYDKYLDKIDALRTKQLEKLYDAYVALKGLQADCNTYWTTNVMSRIEQDSERRDYVAAQATVIVVSSERCHELLGDALSEFAGGPEFVAAQKAERGRAIQTHMEISDMLSNRQVIEEDH